MPGREDLSSKADSNLAVYSGIPVATAADDNSTPMDEGGAGALVREAQPVEAGSPAAIEAPFEADLIASSFVSWHECGHGRSGAEGLT